MTDPRAWLKPKRGDRKGRMVPATLKEVHADSLAHWDARFYACLQTSLPADVCECKRRIKNACPIHARSPERTYPLREIYRHIANNRLREQLSNHQ